MKKYLWLVAVCMTVLSSCMSSNKTIFEWLDEMPAKNIENYHFDPASSIGSRISEAPDFLLAYLQEMDNVDNYTSYVPSDQEWDIVASYLTELPVLHDEILKKRLIGIFFINNFIGSGMADYVLDENNDIYSLLIINPETLRHDITTWMTHRENTCFQDDSSDIEVAIECGDKYLGLMYVLLHEATHIVDYVKAMTPYTEPDIKAIKRGEVSESTVFTKNIWQERTTPVESYKDDFQEEITFYGLGGGPILENSMAPEIYGKLQHLPFVSLYGSMNWAEDFAEYVFWIHYTQKLGQPYEIRVVQKDHLMAAYSPMDFEHVKSRISVVEELIY